MRVRAIDSNGDWSFGRGKSDYKADILGLVQNIRTRLKSFLGDCFFAQSEGIDWWNLLGSKRQLDLRLAVATTILNTEGVNGMVELSVDLNADRTLTLKYIVTSVYGTAQSIETIEVV